MQEKVAAVARAVETALETVDAADARLFEIITKVLAPRARAPMAVALALARKRAADADLHVAVQALRQAVGP